MSARYRGVSGIFVLVVAVVYKTHAFDEECALERASIREAGLSLHATVVEAGRSCQVGELVIPRFGVLPFARDNYAEFAAARLRPVNSLQQHLFLADIGAQYDSLGALTARTWRTVMDIPASYEGAYFVKGATNSMRQRWSTHAYAEDRSKIGGVLANLACDSLLVSQQLYIREFIPLRQIGESVAGMPLSEEYRFFVLHGEILCGGAYWPAADTDVVPGPHVVPREFLASVMEAVGERAVFYTIDVARRVDGGWIVVELNDGCQSGLCGCCPDELWQGVSVLLASSLHNSSDSGSIM